MNVTKPCDGLDSKVASCNKRLDKMRSTRPTVELKLHVPWGHIAAKAWGSPKATRVLVVHGTQDNAGSFDRIMLMLPKNFYYVVLDLPGHGFSSPLPLGIQLDFMNYVLAIRLVLDELKWNNCIYLGHSLGGHLGMFTSFMHPERITKLVCIEGFVPNPTDRGLLKAMRSIQEIAVQAISAKSPRLYTKDEILYALKNKRQYTLNSAAAEALFHRATTRVNDLYKYNRDFRLRIELNGLFNSDQYAVLINRVKIPVLIVLAESSWFTEPLIAQAFQKVSENKPNFTVIMVPGNHDVHNNNPEIVAPHVNAFLNGASNSKL